MYIFDLELNVLCVKCDDILYLLALFSNNWKVLRVAKSSNIIHIESYNECLKT